VFVMSLLFLGRRLIRLTTSCQSDSHRLGLLLSCFQLSKSDRKRLSLSCCSCQHKTSDYEALGLDPISVKPPSQKEIKEAYLGVVRLHHPDISDKPESAEIFRRAQEAYDKLSKATSAGHSENEGDGSYVQYDDDGKIRRKVHHPEEERIREMLWREEMIKRRKEHAKRGNHPDEEELRQVVFTRLDHDRPFTNLFAILATALVLFATLTILSEKGEQRRLRMEADELREQQIDYRLSKEYAIEKQKKTEEILKKQWELIEEKNQREEGGENPDYTCPQRK